MPCLVPRYKLCCFLLAIAAFQPVPAQQIYQVGQGLVQASTEGESPFGTFFEDNRNQFLVRASELRQLGAYSGQIMSLAFNVTIASSQPMADFGIFIRQTTDTSVSGTFQPMGTFTQVWQGNHVAHPGWNTFQFSQPFLWDGQSNILIQTCFDNASFSTNSTVLATYTSFPSNLYGFSDSQFPDPCANHPSLTASTLRPNIRLEILSNTFNDAGIPTLESPVAFCPGLHPVEIVVQNFGRNQIDSVTITWVFDGILQPQIQFTGLLDTMGGQGLSSAVVHLGNRTFLAGHTHSMAVWTSNPNGVSDTANLNDTLIALMKPSLQGAYTIGGTGADYTSLSDAVSDLNTVGICGPVVFDIRPGTYVEQIDLLKIPGASAINTVIFRAENGDSSSVLLQYASATFATNYVVQFTDARHVHFERMTLEATDPFYGTVFRFNAGHVDSVSISNCEIRSSSGTSSSSSFSALLNSGAVMRGFRFEENYVHHCAFGYYNVAGVDSMVLFQGNEIRPFYMGIRTENSFSPVIMNNRVEGTSVGFNSAFYGLYLTNISGTPQVIGNDVNARIGSYGLYISGMECDSIQPGLIANNMVHTGGSGTGVACYMAGIIRHVDVYYNTFHSTATGPTSRGMWVAASGSGLRLVNNIFSNTGSGFALFCSGTALIARNDFNCYYTTSPNFVQFGAVVSTLQALQIASGMDQNSIVADPGYYDGFDDLHITSIQLKGTGTPLPEVQTDIDGELRDTLTPDIGADEFVPLDHDLALLGIVAPQVLGCGISDSTEVVVAILNQGQLPQSGFEVAFRIYNITVATEIVTDTVLPGDTLLYTFLHRVDLTHPSIYPMSAWTHMPQEQNRRNDTVLFHTLITDIGIDTFPYLQTFDDTPGAIPQGWMNDPFDDGEDWFFHGPSSTQTPSPNGIFGDHSTGTGHFAWVDNSVPNSAATNLLTPCFDFSQLANPHLEFFFWNGDAGQNIRLRIDVWHEGQWHMDVAPPMGHQLGNRWEYKLVNLSAFRGSEARIRFRAEESGSSNLYDMAIDDVKVFDLGPVNTGVVAISNPVSGCGLTDFEPVEIRVVQFGYDTLPQGTSIPVGFSVNGGQLHQEVLVLAAALGQFDTADFRFAGVADVSSAVTHSVMAWTNTPQDNDPTNDSLQKQVSNGIITQLPYVQTFDGFTASETATGFQDFWHTIPENTLWQYRWNVASGPSPTTFTGPSADHPDGQGNYVYTEANSGMLGEEAMLITPCFDLAGINNPGLNFHYHMFGSGIGSLHLDAYFNDHWITDIMPPLVGNKGDQWHLNVVDLSAFITDKVSFRFRAKRGNSISGDIAIDWVKVGEIPVLALSDTLWGCGSIRIDAGNPGGYYQWSTGATTQVLDAVGNTFQTVVMPISLTVTNTAGLSNKAQTVVVIEPGPYLDLGGFILECEKDSIVLDAGNPNASYIWDNGNTSRYRFVDSPGTYHVSVTGGLGCIKHDSVLVDFGKYPIAEFNYARSNGQFSVSFQNTSKHGSTFLWDFGNGFTSTARDPVHVFQQPNAMYVVMLIVVNNCGSDTIMQSISTYPVGGLQKEDYIIEVFPNPMVDELTIRVFLPEVQQTLSLSLVDALGRPVHIKAVGNVSQFEEQIPATHLPSGLYILRLDLDGQVLVRPIVKR